MTEEQNHKQNMHRYEKIAILAQIFMCAESFNTLDNNFMIKLLLVGHGDNFWQLKSG